MHAQKRRRTRVPPFVVRPPFSPHRCVYDNTCVFIDGELRRCLISNPFDGLFNMCFHSNAIWAFVYCPLFFSFLHSSSLFSLYLFSAIVFFVLNCCFQPRMVQNDFQFYLFLFFCDRSGRSFAMLIISLSLSFLSPSCVLFGCCPITNPVSAIFFTVSYFPPAIRSG